MQAHPVLPLQEPAALTQTLSPGTFSHGPFLVESGGTLVPRRVQALRFSWRGRPCEARLADGKVKLAAAVGAMPYTAKRGADRPAVFTAINALGGRVAGRLAPAHAAEP